MKYYKNTNNQTEIADIPAHEALVPAHKNKNKKIIYKVRR